VSTVANSSVCSAGAGQPAILAARVAYQCWPESVPPCAKARLAAVIPRVSIVHCLAAVPCGSRCVGYLSVHPIFARSPYHIYFLQAPRSLKEGWRRHTAAQLGHATSTDLRHWTCHGIALGPGEDGAWDDLALWTGSTVKGDDGVWRMFYTTINSRGLGVENHKIGLAESDDLFVWFGRS
jgi:hypothetical protein